MSQIPDQSADCDKKASLDQSPGSVQPKRILIVDDEIEFAKLLQIELEYRGYKVDSAQDGVQAIKKIMVTEYSAVLCDMIMPNLAGDMFYAATERVKPHLCKRFVFMTGFQSDPKITTFIRKVHGIVLWKPFKMHLLFEALQAVESK